MHKKLYSSHWFYKIKYFYSIVKMNANYAEICRVGNLKAEFQQIRLFNFPEISQYCCETSIIQIQQRKVKIIFLDENSKTITLQIAKARSIFCHNFDFRVYI